MRSSASIVALFLLAACPGDGGRDPGATATLPASTSSGATGSDGATATATASSTGDEATTTTTTGDATSTSGSSASTDTTAAASTGVPACPDGVICVDSFPFTDMRDTSAGVAQLDGYACAPDTDESGPEFVYRVTVPAAGFLSAAVYDDSGVDIDVHVLSALDPASCLDRGDLQAAVDVEAGDYWIIADTYAGDAQAGPYRIDIGFIEPSVGPCEVEVGEMARVGDGGNHLPMPATGPIVKEAHLVTADEPPPYPQTSTDELDAHYALSQATTGLVMHRDQDWAPLEGGDFYGAGIGDPADFPALHEGWYVNMYWTAQARPAAGTRMILRAPGGDRAVVVAAGYETGPGDLAHIGGTPEESHFYMRTNHLDTMQLGIAVDQLLPFGPRTCQ